MYVYLAIIVTGVSCLSYGTKPCPNIKGHSAQIAPGTRCTEGYYLYNNICINCASYSETQYLVCDGNCEISNSGGSPGDECTIEIKEFCTLITFYNTSGCHNNTSTTKPFPPLSRKVIYHSNKVTRCATTQSGD